VPNRWPAMPNALRNSSSPDHHDVDRQRDLAPLGRAWCARAAGGRPPGCAATGPRRGRSPRRPTASTDTCAPPPVSSLIASAGFVTGPRATVPDRAPSSRGGGEFWSWEMSTATTLAPHPPPPRSGPRPAPNPARRPRAPPPTPRHAPAAWVDEPRGRRPCRRQAEASRASGRPFRQPPNVGTGLLDPCPRTRGRATNGRLSSGPAGPEVAGPTAAQVGAGRCRWPRPGTIAPSGGPDRVGHVPHSQRLVQLVRSQRRAIGFASHSFVDRQRILTTTRREGNVP